MDCLSFRPFDTYSFEKLGTKSANTVIDPGKVPSQYDSLFKALFESLKVEKWKKRIGFSSLHPKTWAAIAPIVGWGHPDLMEPIAQYQIPVWVFAGGRDNGVELRYFYAGLNKLEELGHPDVRFTIEADMGHDTWRRVYAGEDLYNWFLSHKKEK